MQVDDAQKRGDKAPEKEPIRGQKGQCLRRECRALCGLVAKGCEQRPKGEDLAGKGALTVGLLGVLNPALGLLGRLAAVE